MGGYYFPMFVDISTKRILVIGGGKIAARRVRTLLKFAEHIEVTAPEICDEMKDILKEEEKKEVPQAVWSSRKVLEEDLKDTSDFLNGADIVLTATDDRELNQKIVSACRMRKILVNTADDKSLESDLTHTILQSSHSSKNGQTVLSSRFRPPELQVP